MQDTGRHTNQERKETKNELCGNTHRRAIASSRAFGLGKGDMAAGAGWRVGKREDKVVKWVSVFSFLILPIRFQILDRNPSPTRPFAPKGRCLVSRTLSTRERLANTWSVFFSLRDPSFHSSFTFSPQPKFLRNISCAKERRSDLDLKTIPHHFTGPSSL